MTHSDDLNTFEHVRRYIELEKNNVKAIGPKFDVHMASVFEPKKSLRGRGNVAQCVDTDAISSKKARTEGMGRTEGKSRAPLKAAMPKRLCKQRSLCPKMLQMWAKGTLYEFMSMNQYDMYLLLAILVKFVFPIKLCWLSHVIYGFWIQNRETT